jgi:hypothetical protein
MKILQARQQAKQWKQVSRKAAKIKYCCGKKGHMSPECPDKNSIKKEDWHNKKATQYYMEANKADVYQDDQLDGDNESTTSKASSQIGWNGLLIKQKESLYDDGRDAKDRLKNCITLDNGSTLSLSCASR